MLGKFRYNKPFDGALSDYIYNCLLPQNSVTSVKNYSDVFSGINMGDCLLFIDTLEIAFDIDVKKYEHRNISVPVNESAIKGPQEGFVENIRTNTSLIRRIVNNENLVIETIPIGKISKIKCSVCYLQNIANGDLVSEIKYRLNNLAVDSLLSTGELEQLIEDDVGFGIPHVLSTERPDKCAKYLFQGRIVLLLNGNPYSIILPATIEDFLFSPEDTNLRPLFANFLRIIRILAAITTLLLPGLYMAVTNFHQELLPTELLFSILSARENVPFPIILEIILLELAFELIREASLRVPSLIASSIGIVGALILGDAAVNAGIVSPILIIIVAIIIIAFAIYSALQNQPQEDISKSTLFINYTGDILALPYGSSDINIYDDGKIWARSVEKGKVKNQITEEEVNKLKEKLREIDYNNLNKEYNVYGNGNYEEIKINMDGNTKDIKFNYIVARYDSSNLPKELNEFMRLLKQTIYETE